MSMVLSGVGVVFVLVLVTAVTIWRGIAALARSRQEAIWAMLATALDRGLPAAAAIRACAAAFPPTLEQRLRALAELLELGMPLPEALDQLPGLVPAPARLMAHLGHASGTVGPLFQQSLERQHARRGMVTALLRDVTYLLTVLVVLQVLVVFLAVITTPKFRRILDEFHVQLEGPARWMMSQSGAELVLGVAGGIVAVCAIVLAVLIGCRAFGLIPSLSEFFDDWFFPADHRVWLLTALAAETRIGGTVEGVLRVLAEHDSSSRIRTRMARAREAIGAGQPTWKSLAQAGLIRPNEVVLLEAAERCGNLSWALDELAWAIDRRQRRRLQTLRNILVPTVTVAMAGVVLLCAIGYLAPFFGLVRRIEWW